MPLGKYTAEKEQNKNKQNNRDVTSRAHISVRIHPTKKDERKENMYHISMI